LYYFSISPEFRDVAILAMTGSSGRQRVQTNAVASHLFLFPSLSEQKAIGEVLSSLDDKIDLLHRQNKTLESLAEILFRHRFIENAQDDWEEKQLDEIADIGIGRTPPRKEFEWFSKNSDDVKWISIKDLGEQGVFIFNTAEYLTQEAVEKFRIPIIPKDTVVLSFKMTLGRVGVTSEAMLSNEAIAHFKIKDENLICKEFLYVFLKKFQYETLGTTSSIVTSINSGMIKELPVVIPDLDNMVKFKEQSQQFFNKIRENQKQIQTLEKLRETLLPKLISGDVRVQYEEVA
jgi:type I restriction enzyme S subunit